MPKTSLEVIATKRLQIIPSIILSVLLLTVVACSRPMVIRELESNAALVVSSQPEDAPVYVDGPMHIGYVNFDPRKPDDHVNFSGGFGPWKVGAEGVEWFGNDDENVWHIGGSGTPTIITFYEGRRATNISMLVGDGDARGETFTVTFYDENDTILRKTTYSVDYSKKVDFLGPVHKIKVELAPLHCGEGCSESGAVLDNFHFQICVAAQEGQEPDRPKEIIGKDGAEMVLIPAGEFEMGTDLSEVPQLVQWAKKWYSSVESSWFEREAPRHTVYLDIFYMDRYEVTNALYKKFIDATGHKAPRYWNDSKRNTPDHPVVGVIWDDAKAYAEWAGKRLPTEAEWEKAARDGLVGRKYPWGDSEPDGSQCNFADRNTDFDWSDKSVDDGYGNTAPVGSFTPNGYGLYDMAGNVWEWCADWYGEKYYSSSPTRNPTGPGLGTGRVVRGGSRLNNPFGLRVGYSHMTLPTNTSIDYGFRCVSQD